MSAENRFIEFKCVMESRGLKNQKDLIGADEDTTDGKKSQVMSDGESRPNLSPLSVDVDQD